MSTTNEAVLKEILEKSLAGYWDWDILSGKEYLSPSFKKMFGYEDHEIENCADSWQKLIFQEDLAGIFKKFNEHEESNGDIPFHIEVRYHHKNGSTVWVICTGSVIEWDVNGKAARMVGCHIDITPRKQTEETLLRTIYELKKSQEVAKVGNWVWHISQNRVEWSDEMYRIFGIDKELFSGDLTKVIDDCIHPDDRAEVDRSNTSVMEQKTPIPVEYRIVRPDGSVRVVWAEAGELELDEAGKPMLLRGIVHDITDRKRAEEKIKSQNTLLSMITETTPVGIVTVDKNGNITYANKRAEEILGLVKDEITSLAYDAPLWNHINIDGSPFPDEKQPFNIVKTTMSSTYDIQHGIIWPDGTVVLLSINASPMKDTQGNFDGMLATIEDITDRKQAEVSLRESEAKLSAIFSSMDEMVVLHELVFDGQGKPVNYRIIDCNDAYTRITGITRESAVGQLASEVYGTSEPPYLKEYSEVALTGEPCQYETYFPPMDKHFAISAVRPQKNCFATVTTDITIHKQTEDAIAAEKEQLAVTLRSIGDGVITTDTLGNIVIMNKVAEDLCGWKQDESQGKPLFSVFNIINQNTREPHENPVEKVLSTGNIIELENHTLLISRDGTERVIADSGAPIKDKESKTIGVVLVFRDMTEKHKLLNNMQRTDKLEALGTLAGGIAHDFNNLLSGIFGYIEMARKRTTSDPTVLKYLDKTLTVFERAKDLTQQLLTFSKGGEPKLKTGHLGKLIKENADFVLSGTNVRCDYQIAEDLWLADYDENQIEQVIDNVVLNAQHAMPGGGTIVISVNNHSLIDSEKLTLKKDNYIKISITDTGIGIPQELLKKIFDPFFTTKQKGYGLGLATCYSIVQKHDGSIDVESVPGKGSTFHIYLPAAYKGTILNSTKIAARHEGKGCILVMDDEAFMREIVGTMVKTMGYTCIEAENGEEALQLCGEAKKQGRPISAALFDLTIPGGMGGKETIVKFRQQFPEVPVFASSGFSEDPSMARPTESGFTDSIRKPFRIGELADMLNKHI